MQSPSAPREGDSTAARRAAESWPHIDSSRRTCALASTLLPRRVDLAAPSRAPRAQPQRDVSPLPRVHAACVEFPRRACVLRRASPAFPLQPSLAAPPPLYAAVRPLLAASSPRRCALVLAARERAVPVGRALVRVPALVA